MSQFSFKHVAPGMQADSAPKGLCGFEDVTSFVPNFRRNNITFKKKGTL